MITDLQSIQDRIVAAKRATRDDIHEALFIIRSTEGANVQTEITALVEPIMNPKDTEKLLSDLDSYGA